MKRIICALFMMLFIAPCLGNIHINPDTVVSVVQEFVPSDKVESTLSEYNTMLKSSGGTGISAQNLWDICVVAGWDISQSVDKERCVSFVNTLVKNSSLKVYPACDKQYKGKSGYICVDDFFTNKLYGGTQVNLTPALALAREYAKIKYNDTSVQCSQEPRQIKVGLDYGIKCASRNKNSYYEFIFDDVKESDDKTIQDSIQTAVCKIYDAKATVSGCNTSGTNINTTTTCWGASCQADAKKCEQINQSLAQFGYSAVYQDDECRIDFNAVHDKADLKSAYGIDNFVFCHGIQVANTPNVETYLKQYIAERAGVSASSVKCDSGFNTYTGDGCAANGITNLKDDIKTCRVGDNQIDFVFDDINEKWKKTAQGGVQGMSCIVTGGTYSGKRCVGLGEQQCNILRQSNLTECPECRAATWDDETQSCILPSSKSAQNLQRGINITMIVGGAIVGIVITVATVGTATAAVAGAAAATKSAIAFTAIETVGAGIEVAAQLKIDAIADDFLVESNKCKDATCAKEMLSQNLQRMANVQNDMTDAEADAVDSEMARLANLIPDDDEIWATMLVNGTDMADNKAGFLKSWEPEQVWRAVGIGLQLASLITGITKWAISKSSRLAKSTAAIKQKFDAAIENIDRAAESTLTDDKLLVKHRIAAVKTADSDLSDTEAAWRELHRKYAPRNQSLDDFKAMADNDLSKMQQMSKGWISWDNPLYDESMKAAMNEARTNLPQVKKELDDFWRTAPDEVLDLYLDNPKEFARQYPKIEVLNAKMISYEEVLEHGFTGNYSTLDNNVQKNIKPNAQKQIDELNAKYSEVEDYQNKRVEEGQITSKEAKKIKAEARDRIKTLTTDNVLHDIGNTVKLSRADEVALLRAEQIHDIIESDDWLTSMKRNWYNLSTGEKTVFAQEVSDRLLEKNGIPFGKGPKIYAEELPKDEFGGYSSASNKTKIDFDKHKTFEEFINTVAHENGGHAIDYLNPNANAVGAQLQDASKGLFGADYDAYRAKPTEQSAWAIGDFASVINSRSADVLDVLTDIADGRGVADILDSSSGQIISSYDKPAQNLVKDLFLNPSDTKVLIMLKRTKGAADVVETLEKTRLFNIVDISGGWIAVPIKQ